MTSNRIIDRSDAQKAAHVAKLRSELTALGYAIIRKDEPEEAGVPYGIIDPDYARVFSMVRCLSWAEGYALLFHGSFTRDLDLVAVPWTKAACEPNHLLKRIVAAGDLGIVQAATLKDHGRLAWTLVFKAFGDPRFIDFSIMPRSSAFDPAQG